MKSKYYQNLKRTWDQALYNYEQKVRVPESQILFVEADVNLKCLRKKVNQRQTKQKTITTSWQQLNPKLMMARRVVVLFQIEKMELVSFHSSDL